MNVLKNPLVKSVFARASDSHKYDYGRVLVIGGSKSMAGAPVLAGRAALRAGAGVVELCVPDCVAAVVAAFDPCLIVHGLTSDTDGCFAAKSTSDLCKFADRADVIVCGPGLGRSPELVALVKMLWQEMPQTMIVDADALYALSCLDNDLLTQHVGVRIITPHAGEMRRLKPVSELQAQAISSDSRLQLEKAANEFAAQNQAIVVLKGPNTLITNGTQYSHNVTGNPGMATAGTGDVLAGIIAALVGQGLPVYQATELAVLAHGMAGDLAAKSLTELSVTANDLIDYLPQAWQKIRCQLDEV